ncbi:MAG: hypothetical protein P8Z49_07560 [Acidobacteriota bacterium]|jgi:hypothetical protein
MEVTFTEQELDLLKRILDSSLRQLRQEVHHTRDSEYREQLKHRENVLRSILEKVEVEQPVQTVS